MRNGGRISELSIKLNLRYFVRLTTSPPTKSNWGKLGELNMTILGFAKVHNFYNIFIQKFYKFIILISIN